MAKPDDTLSPDDPASARLTPVPLERSGSISIASGDFTTPMVRRRTITRPRGLPALDVVPVDGADVPTPPPLTNGTPLADVETPPPLVDGAPALAIVSAPSPEAGAPTESAVSRPEPELSLHDQASRLRAAEIADNDAAADQVTPPPTPMVMAAPTATAVMTPETEPDPGPTPPPVAVVAAPLRVAAAVADADLLTPVATLAVSTEPVADAGSIPVRPMQDSDSERNLTPLAHTLANLAEAQLQTEPARSGDEVGPEEDLELVDAPLDAAPASPVARPAAPPPTPLPQSLPTPPPIPGSHIKTPGPELRARTEAPQTDGVTGDLPIPLSTFPIVPEALAQRPRRAKRSKPWFEEIFDEDYLRTLPFMTSEQTMKEVSFIEESLKAAPAAEILDVGCGYGRHAIELVQRGLNVTGLDLSLPLLLRAADEAQKRSLSVNFVHADMREMPFDRKFDAAYSMLTSFGYFDEDANLRVAEGIARALKPGGRFLLDIVNRDYVVSDLPTRIWWEGVGCVVLEEVDFNFHTSRIVTRRSVVFEDGRQLEQEISVRAYSLHELGRLLRQAGFRVLDISGSMATRGRFFGGTSRNLLILSEKRSE